MTSAFMYTNIHAEEANAKDESHLPFDDDDDDGNDNGHNDVYSVMPVKMGNYKRDR